MDVDDLGRAGRRLWNDVTSAYDFLQPWELFILYEACRTKDNLDRLHKMYAASEDPKLLRDANSTARTMSGLIAALRLPDPKTGRRPIRRGPRGVYRPRRLEPIPSFQLPQPKGMTNG